jgi:oligopeptide transport system permease protein
MHPDTEHSTAPIPADLLLPAARVLELDAVVAAAPSLQRQVMRRLSRNPRAIVAALVLALLALAALTGPWWWPVDPAQQWIAASAQGSSRAQSALIVMEDDAWRVMADGADATSNALLPAAQLIAPQQLTVLEANTERVRLTWQAVPGAFNYRIYRNTQAPRSRSDLGVPLGATLSRGQVSFSDGLLLRQRAYFYSVVASDGADEAAAFAVIETRPRAAIAWLEAQLQGLVPLDAEPAAWSSRSVILPGHPLGTDYLGRDLLARLLQGARISLFIAVAAALAYVALGLVYGAIAGFSGGRIDNAMMRCADFVVALPFLLFMILLRIAFGIGPGESGVLPLVVALVVLSWPGPARLVRGQILLLREEPYIAAARLAGASNSYIIFRHLLPNIFGVVLVALTFAIPNAIFAEAFLSFIGMGVTPPTTSWGAMSNEGLHNLLVHPAELWWPAACISVTVLAFNTLGDALRDALDMRTDTAAS